MDPEPDTESLGGLVGLSYDWKISDSATFSQRLTYYPNLSYELRYRNQPIGLDEDTDTTTRASLVWNI